MSTAGYLLAMATTLALGYYVFRIQVRRDYSLHGALTGFSTLLEFVIFAVHANSAYIFLPVKWPLFPALPDNLVQTSVGLLVVGAGLGFTLLAMSRLGFRKAVGQDQTGLRRAGMYRFTRNPQLIAYFTMLVGCVILWPSWYALGWLAVFAAIAHMMVLTEEEHLLRIFGQEYVDYCDQVPRYFIKG